MTLDLPAPHSPSSATASGGSVPAAAMRVASISTSSAMPSKSTWLGSSLRTPGTGGIGRGTGLPPRISAPVRAFQMLIRPSSPTLTSVVLSGAKATDRTTPAWAARTLIAEPFRASHSGTGASPPPLASSAPSAEKASAGTTPSWPRSVATGAAGSATFQSRITPSAPAPASS